MRGAREPGQPIGLSRRELIAGLAELADALRDSADPVRLRLVGGAAIALAFDADRARTVDVDAELTPRETVLDAAAAIGERRGWPTDWINDAAAQFLPSGYGRRGAEWTSIHRDGAVTIEVGSPEMLLAMKLFAAQSRGRREQRDIAILVAACGISSVEQAEELFDAFYPGDEFTARTAQIVRDAIDSGYTGRNERIGL